MAGLKKEFSRFTQWNQTACKTSCGMCLARFKQMRNKKNMAIKNLKKELAGLLTSQQLNLASIRSEQIINEEKSLNGLGVLELYIEQVKVRVGLIAQQREMPRDMIEGISSIVYASQRMPDVPELLELRKLFGQKYGQEYIKGATNDDSANSNWGVKDDFRQLLYVAAPYNEEKLQVMKDVAKEFNVEVDEAKLEALLPPQIPQQKSSEAKTNPSPNIVESPEANPAYDFETLVYNRKQQQNNPKIQESPFPSVAPQNNQQQNHSKHSMPPSNPDFRPKDSLMHNNDGAYSNAVDNILKGTQQSQQRDNSSLIFESQTSKDARWPNINDKQNSHYGNDNQNSHYGKDEHGGYKQDRGQYNNQEPHSISNVNKEDQELRDMEERLWKLKFN